MAEARPKKGNGQTTGAAKQEKQEQLNVDALFKEMEETARGFIQNVGTWVQQGEELITKTTQWLEDHPVAIALATKYGRKLPVPTSMEDIRARSRNAGERLRSSASRSVTMAKERPTDALLIGAALGVSAWVFLRNR